MDLTAERLREVLSYSPETGEFRWRIRASKKTHVGAVAGCARGGRYWVIRIDHTKHYAHRLAWFYMTGDWPAEQVDHTNGDGRDNRICNLRACSHAENQKNMKMFAGNSSGLKGVRKNRGGDKFSARICVDGKHVHLGSFVSKTEAAKAYDIAAVGYHGAYAHTNGV